MARYTPSGGSNRAASPEEDSGVVPMRPVYPRTQYQMQYSAQGPPRVNAGDISSTSCKLVDRVHHVLFPCPCVMGGEGFFGETV